MFDIKRILVPTDFSDASDAAMDYAAALAKSFNAQLYVLHVPGPNGESFEADFPFGEFLNAGWDRFAPFHPEYVLRIGAPAHGIVRFASDREVDVIIMGTHGHAGLRHLVVGSVAEHVIREADCPVLTVRPARQCATAGDPLSALSGAGST